MSNPAASTHAAIGMAGAGVGHGLDVVLGQLDAARAGRPRASPGSGEVVHVALLVHQRDVHPVLAGVVRVGDGVQRGLGLGPAHGVPEGDLHGRGGVLQGVDGAQRRVDGCLLVSATTASAPTFVVTATTGGGEQGGREQDGDGRDGPAGASADGGGDHAAVSWIGAGSIQPFTAPAVRPRTSWRWKTISPIMIGRAAMIVPAMMRLSWSICDWRSDASPIWTVRWLASVVTRWGHRYWFQAARNENRPRAPMAGRASGHGDLPHEPQVADAVEGGRLPQVLGDGEEHLADQEGAEGEGEERHHERLVGVDPVEGLDGLEVAEHDRLAGHGERRDEDDEPEPPEREVEEGEGVRGQHRGDDLADGDAARRRSPSSAGSGPARRPATPR